MTAVCEVCDVELGDDRHDAHPPGCAGDLCTCDLFVCEDHCPQCHPCPRCEGAGETGPCEHDTYCPCPSWECPDCEGTGVLSGGGPGTGAGVPDVGGERAHPAAHTPATSSTTQESGPGCAPEADLRTAPDAGIDRLGA